MTPTYSTPPKQSSQQVMPGKVELQQLSEQLRLMVEQLQAISNETEPTATARSIVNCPDTPLKLLIKRNLMRFIAVRQRIPKLQRTLEECAEILTDLSN